MKYTKEMGETLNRLLQKNLDAEKGFRNATDDVKDEQLKIFLKEIAYQKYDFAHELRTEIRNFGQSPTKGSSVLSDVQRSWMNIRSGLSLNAEASVLKQAIKAEQAGLEEYRVVLKEHNFPPSTESVLLKQKDAFQATVKRIKELQEHFK